MGTGRSSRSARVLPGSGACGGRTKLALGTGSSRGNARAPAIGPASAHRHPGYPAT